MSGEKHHMKNVTGKGFGSRKQKRKHARETQYKGKIVSYVERCRRAGVKI